MISTEHVIDFDNLVLKDKDVFDDWEYLISEHDGYYSQEDQLLFFDYKGIEVVIGFELAIRGTSWFRRGGYMEPDEGEVNITDVEIDVNYLSVFDEELTVDKDLKKTLSNVVKKYVTNE